MTQKERIIEYINQFGSITSWQAYQDLGIMQLGARIDNYKKRDMFLKQNGSRKRIDMASQFRSKDTT